MKVTHKLYLFFILVSCFLSLFLHKEYMSLDVQGIHSWRQSQTMWNVRNFVRHDNNILNPRVSHFNGGKDNIYRYEFPLMQWGIAQFQKIGGEQIEIARGTLFLLGVLSVFGIYFLARLQFQNDFTAFFTAFLFQFSPVFFYYTINPIPDNLALTGAIWYLYFILKHRNSKKTKYLIFASSCLLISTLAKLPYLMFAVVSIYIFIKDYLLEVGVRKSILKYPLLQFSILIPAFVWYAWVIPGWSGNPILSGIFSSDINYDQYREIFEYHKEVMFPELLLYWPVWLFALLGIPAILYFKKNTGWLISLVFITFLYLILEFNAIGKVHDYYMMPFLPWLYILVGYGIKLIIKLPYLIGYIIAITLAVFAPFHTYNYTSDFWSIEKAYFNNDVFRYSDQLKNAVPQDAMCIILNDNSYYVFSYQIDKMGHIFTNDHLPTPWIEDMIKNHNVEYMYSDSRKIDQDSSNQKYLDTLILKAESVHVYKLKDPDKLK